MTRLPGRYAFAQVLCAIWAVLAPVAPQIHQSIVKHRHVYCVEHNRIEDKPVLSAHERFQQPETTTVSGVALSPTATASGIECLFSNFLAHALTRTSGRTITGVLSAELPSFGVGEIDLRSVDTYRIAPKTSPPTRT